MTDSRSDQELIAAVNAGGPGGAEAFESLYRRHRDWVAGLALRFTGDGDQALDVMQETFLYFLGKFPGFVLTANLKTFFYPAVKHLAIAHRRKTQRFAGDDEVLAAVAAAPSSSPAGTDLADLARVLAVLPAGQREVVVLRFVDGLSLEEIALALSIPTGTVKSRLHNALATLREDPGTRTYFGQEAR